MWFNRAFLTKRHLAVLVTLQLGIPASVKALSNDNIYEFSLQELLKVKVKTAAKSKQTISDAPSIISVVTAQEIENLGISNLSEALSYVAGFTPIEQLKGDQTMVVRGLALKDGVLVLVNGVPLNDAFDGAFNFYQRSLSDVDRIEVLRGPGSALYGSYAVSAVIQIFTKSYKQDDYFQIQTETGSFNSKALTFNGAVQLDFISPNLNAEASFEYSDESGDDYFIKQDSLFTVGQGRFLPPLTNPTLTPTEREKPLEKFNGHLNLNFKETTLSLLHSQLITNPIVSHIGVVTEHEKTIKDVIQSKVSLSHQWAFNDSISLEAQAYWVQNEEKLFGQSQPPQIHGDEDQDGLNENFISGIIENFHHTTESTGLEVALKYPLNENHNLLLGLIYHESKLVDAKKIANVSLISRGPSEIFPTQDTTHEFINTDIKREEKAFYIQNDWTINSRSRLTAGIRFGDFNDFGKTTDPRLGFNHRLNKQWYTKILYGEAFKAPAFAQLFDASPTLSANRRRGNSELEATEIETYEWQIGYEHSTELHTSMTLFRNSTENEIFFNSAPGVEQWQNAGERESEGVEFEVKGQFAHFDVAMLNYSYQDTQGVSQGAGADIHSPHRINFSGFKHFGNDWTFGIGMNFYSKSDREARDQRDKIDSKFLINLSLRKNNFIFNNTTLQFKIKNLFDESGRYETESDIGLLDDLPIEGQRLSVSVSYQF